MATGVWNENNRPTIPGFYNRFKSLAEKRIGTGIHGILAMPVKANWGGPVEKVVSIKDEKDLISKFGKDNTAYRLGRLALLGQPKELLLYRLTDGTEKIASVMLKDTEDTEVLKIETQYPTTRDFNITIRTNIVDDTKKDLILYEAAKQLYVFSELGGTIEEIANSINENVENTWLKVTKTDEGNGKLQNIANETLKGGNDGNSNITSEHYIKSMEVFEGYKADGFTLDGITDESLQSTVKGWVQRNKTKGNNIIAYLGIKDTDTIQQANTKSKEFNFEGIVNVGVSGYYEGIKYTPSETACYIAGLATGQRLKESMCNQKTIFEDVEPRLSKEEVEIALASGTLVLAQDDNEIIVVDDVNTLKRYQEDQTIHGGVI